MVDKVKKKIIINRKKSNVIGIVVWLISTGIAFSLQKLVHKIIVVYPYFFLNLIIFIPFILHEPLHYLGFLIGGVDRKDLVLKRYKGLLPFVKPKGFIKINTYIKAVLLPNVVIPLIFLVMVIVSDSIIYSLIFGLTMSMTIIDLFVIKELKSFEDNCMVACLEDEFGFYIE